jgi:hypothetical protein
MLLRIAVSVCALVVIPAIAESDSSVADDQTVREQTVSRHARGTFQVKMAPQGEVDSLDGTSLGRMSLDKTFLGDLVATGKGQMLTGMTGTEGSAVYVAVERVVGTLDGHEGAFVLVHRGIMNRNVPEMAVRIVPDSGSGALAGIAGEMTIAVVDGEHRYDLAYTMPGDDLSRDD